MKFSIELTQKDWDTFNNYLKEKNNSKIKWAVTGFWGNMLLWLCIGLISMFCYRYSGNKIHWPTFLLACLFVFIFYLQYLWNSSRIKKSIKPSERDSHLKRYEYTVDENGVITEGHGYKGFYEWPLINSVEQNQHSIMLFIDNYQALILPKSQLNNPEELFDIIKRYNV